MISDFEQLQALRECCRDEAAFAQLQKILAQWQADCVSRTKPEELIHLNDPKPTQEAEAAINRDRRLFASGPVTVFRWLAADNWPVEYVSPNVTQWGYQSEDFTSRRMSYASIIHPADLALVTAELKRCEAAGLNVFKNDYRIIRADGQVRWVYEYTVFVRNEQGVITHYEGYILDISDRKLFETQLKESEERFRLMVEGSEHVFFYIHDNEHRWQYLSPSVENVLGYTPEELVGQRYDELLTGYLSDEKGNKLRDRAIFTGERSTPYVVLFQRRDGRRMFLEIVETPIITDGKAIGIQGFARDITDHKLAEIALSESEEKFSKAFRCSPDPITITTLEEGRFIDVNDSFLRITEYERDEVIGRTSFDLNIWVHPEDRLRVKAALQNEGAVVNQEFEFRRKSGETFVVLSSAEIISLGGEQCLIFVNHDISLRKQAEAQLRMSAQRDRLLTEIASRIRQSLNLDQILNTTVTEIRQFLQADRVYILDLSEGSTSWVAAESANLNYCSLREWTPIDDNHVKEICACFAENRVCVINDTTQVEFTGAIAQDFVNYQIRACIGVSITVCDQFFGLLIANQCSQPRQWQSFEIELLEQLATQLAIAIQQAKLYEEVQAFNASLERQVEERTQQLQQKYAELQELNQIKDEFLHAFSHDLRTPIMGTLLVLKNLQRQNDSSSTNPGDTVSISRLILERMMQSSERQLNLINSLLEAHSSEVRGIVLRYELLQLNSLIQAIAEDLEPMLVKNQATLIDRVPADLPFVTADPLQLRRVFENLLTNALNHNPPGLTLILGASVEQDMIRCTVADNGVGMNPEVCDRLFERYVRGDSLGEGFSSHARSTGIGLGLYLCRQIITAHGGQIGVTSNRGSGSTFWFTLPLIVHPIGL